MGITKNYNRQDLKVAHVDINMSDLVSGVAAEAMDIPPNAVIVGGSLTTKEAWDSTTSDVMSVGDEDSAARYLSGGDIRALAANVALVPTGFLSTGKPLLVTWTSGGGTPTTGITRLAVQYFVEGRAETTYG